MARHKLDLSAEPDVAVIGISCHENDYRLCWALNKSLDLALTRRATDVASEGGPARFAAFDHLDDDGQVTISLVSNRSEGLLLVKDQKQADFFLLVDEHAHLTAAETLDRARSTEFILAAFAVDAKRLRSGPGLFA